DDAGREENEKLGFGRIPGVSTEQTAEEWNAREDGDTDTLNVPLFVGKAAQSDRLGVLYEKVGADGPCGYHGGIERGLGGRAAQFLRDAELHSAVGTHRWTHVDLPAAVAILDDLVAHCRVGWQRS